MKLRSIYKEFRQCLKPLYIEEIFDLVVFRPIAFALVQLARPFPITPNHISMLGMLASVAGGLFFALGGSEAFLIGGLCSLTVSVLDNADGMLARLKGGGTKVGRIVDGFFDYTTTTLLLVGFWWGFRSGDFWTPLRPWIIVLAAWLLTALQALVVDYYKNQFLAHALNLGRPIEEEIEEYKEEQQRLKTEGDHFIERLLIWLYLGYSRVQARLLARSNRRYAPKPYFKRMVPLVRLWTLIGPGTHRAAIILAALMYQPWIFLGYALVIANTWMIIMLIAQVLAKRGLPALRAARKKFNKPRLARAAQSSQTR